MTEHIHREPERVSMVNGIRLQYLLEQKKNGKNEKRCMYCGAQYFSPTRKIHAIITHVYNRCILSHD